MRRGIVLGWAMDRVVGLLHFEGFLPHFKPSSKDVLLCPGGVPMRPSQYPVSGSFRGDLGGAWDKRDTTVVWFSQGQVSGG